MIRYRVYTIRLCKALFQSSCVKMMLVFVGISRVFLGAHGSALPDEAANGRCLGFRVDCSAAEDSAGGLSVNKVCGL